MDTTKYSHNLHIAITDDNNNIIENPTLLENIYSEFANKIIIKHAVSLETFDIEIRLLWEYLSLTKIQKHFMGDLFTVSLHSDTVLYEATKVMFSEIETKLKMRNTGQNWYIHFHISKLIVNLNAIYPLAIY